jgi:hypothetical protein
MTGDEVDQWIIGGRAADPPHYDTLHVVVVVSAAGIAGLQRVVEIGALPRDSAQPAKQPVVSKL